VATTVHSSTEINGLRNTLPFGPYKFETNHIFDQFLATEIEISGTSTAQLVGGVSPTIAAFTEINFLLLYPNQDIKVGLHGVTASSAGWTLNAYAMHATEGGSINSLQVYNTAATTVNLFVILGQR
jgi:hypothetical protein